MPHKNVIYKATVTSNKEIKEYIGSTGNTFKSRWYNHNHSFNTYKENSTELAKYIWFLKNNNINYNIEWNIIHHIGEVRSIHNICSNCSLEKLEIAKANRRNNLSKRYELFANCPHFKKLYFKTSSIVSEHGLHVTLFYIYLNLFSFISIKRFYSNQAT